MHDDSTFLGILSSNLVVLAKAVRDPAAYCDGPVSASEVRREARRRLLGGTRFNTLALRADTLRVIRRQVGRGDFVLARSNLRFLQRSRSPKAADLPIPTIP